MSGASRLSFYSLRRTMEWWHDGEIKITQTLQVCLPYWLLHEPLSAPLFHLLRSVLPSWMIKAPEKSQSSLHSPRDSIQEWGPFSTTTPPGAGAEDQPEFWLHEALNTPARLVQAAGPWGGQGVASVLTASRTRTSPPWHMFCLLLASQHSEPQWTGLWWAEVLALRFNYAS